MNPGGDGGAVPEESRPQSGGPEGSGLRPTEVRLLETLLRDGDSPAGEIPP